MFFWLLCGEEIRVRNKEEVQEGLPCLRKRGWRFGFQIVQPGPGAGLKGCLRLLISGLPLELSVEGCLRRILLYGAWMNTSFLCKNLNTWLN